MMELEDEIGQMPGQSEIQIKTGAAEDLDDYEEFGITNRVMLPTQVISRMSQQDELAPYSARAVTTVDNNELD